MIRNLLSLSTVPPVDWFMARLTAPIQRLLDVFDRALEVWEDDDEV